MQNPPLSAVEKWAASVKGFLDGDKSKIVLTGPVTLNERDRTITFEGWKMVSIMFRARMVMHGMMVQFTGRHLLMPATLLDFTVNCT